jgi:chitin disaccharide deacetylase
MTTTNRILGYPDDARLLLINADDFGMCHAINAAILLSMQQGVVASTSLMPPCPWALHGLKVLQENPDLDFGVHLTLICEHNNYKWRPLVSREKVPSLVDTDGFFHPDARKEEAAAQFNIAEVELEYRAQIEMVLAAGLKPNKLDWHCLGHGGRDDIFALTLRLAQEYGLAVRVSPPYTSEVQAKGLPAAEHDLLDSYTLDVVNKAAIYAQMLRDLPIGLTEWAVHPGLRTEEMAAIETGQVRQTDFDFVMSAEARAIIQQEGIILVNYQTLHRAWVGK